ncbi:discoidin domain-containing receptor 2-like [Onthophagus taurus]|uniref:discoidin domain-containing receptor 2-like n=1 Tax=Onthophagus taurus TaxID=166361 RepID=UPI000C20C490|nr:discoidin domain-containing receptor 2-like [Onthophagus taurus]
MTMIVVWFFSLLGLFSTSCVAVDDHEECRAPLGMQEGRIPDHAITASSSYEAKSVGPQNARLRMEKNGGAWCPKAQISSEVREYLEIDLQKNHLITWTETQGRFGNGQGQEYAEAFLVEYWRSSLNQWVVYKDSRGEKVLTGNSNTYLVVRQRLELPFIANKVRFIPYSEHPRTVCMRVELYGCSHEQHIVQYDAPRGNEQNAKVDLDDISYDGILDGNYMRGGLGQLVDGLYGGDDYQKQLQGESSGSRWIGWHNNTLEGSPLEITFQFDSIRDFTAVHIHTNNMFMRGVQIFSSVELYFGLHPGRFQEFPITKVIAPDQINESARNITIRFKPKLSKFIRLRLRFADKWILLSEITFESTQLQHNLTDEMLEKYYSLFDIVQSTSAPPRTGGEIIHARKEIAPETSPTHTTQTYIGLITGSLAMVVLLLACTVLLMIKRGRKKVALLHKHTALVSSSTKPGITMNMKDLKMNMSTPIINNGLSRLSFNNKSASDTINSKKSKICNLYGHVNGEESDSENSVYHEPYKLLPAPITKFGCNPEMKGVNGFPDDLKFSSPSSFYNLNPPSALMSTLPSKHESPAYQTPNVVPDQYYAATDIIKTERKEQHFTPGRFTSIKLPESPPVEGVTQLLEFPRHKLRLLEKMGEGDYGTIHFCEAEGLPDYNGSTIFHKKHVIMKSLWKNTDDKKRNEFLKEISWLAGVRDPNIARVLGFCSQDEPMCALLEYSEFGELARFLVQNSSNDESHNQSISYGCLIFIATQIASGMKYLESLDLVHRDLSARNCVIDKHFNVKVSDHAMYCDRYHGDYYISDTKSKLPIRWMSWESLLLGKQTTKSDVWSFAVTLWEILMFCLQQPYAELTNEQVIENSSHWYQNDGCQRYLSRPTICPREIYDLMGECWKRNATDRPRFAEIHLFLQRKNLGYLPASIC